MNTNIVELWKIVKNIAKGPFSSAVVNGIHRRLTNTFSSFPTFSSVAKTSNRFKVLLMLIRTVVFLHSEKIVVVDVNGKQLLMTMLIVSKHSKQLVHY